MIRTLIGAFGLCLTLNTFAQTPAERCEKLWSEINSRYGSLGLDGMRKALESHRSECVGTGIFESRLSALYFEGGRYDEAEKLLLEGLRRPNPYHKILRFSLADIDIARGNYEGAKAKARDLVKDYPAWEGGYRMGAKAALMQKNFKESIEYGLAANRIAPEAGVFLGLAIAYHQLDMHGEAVNAAYEGIKLNPKVVGKAAGINEAIYSLVQLKREDDARKLARARIDADPNWRSDAALVRAIQYLERRAK